MKRINKLIILLLLPALSMACKDESELALQRQIAPVVLIVSDAAADAVEATFYELDKSGILDHTVGIDSIAVPNLAIEVFAGGQSLGMFTTDEMGSILISYAAVKPTEYVGSYKGVNFRIRK